MTTTCASDDNIGNIVLYVTDSYLHICFATKTGICATHCVRKSSQTGEATVCRARKDTLEQHVLDGNDDETNIEFFLHSNDAEIRRIFAEAISTHTYVLKLVTYILVSPAM